MKSIDLSHNQSLYDLTSFYSLKYITDLESVNLSGIPMSGQFEIVNESNKVEKFPTSRALKELILEDCNLTNEDLLDLSKFSYLVILNISSNKDLSQSGLETYFRALGENNTLEELNMSNLDKVGSLPDFVNMNKLKKLTFDNMKNLLDISSLANSSLSNLEELSFNDCKSIKLNNQDSAERFDNMINLKVLSITNALEWINAALYDHLIDIVRSDPKAINSINPNDLHLQLFENEKNINYNNFSDYRKNIIIGVEELTNNKNHTVSGQTITIPYEENLYNLVISFLNDDLNQADTSLKLVIPAEYRSLTIYGRPLRKYNIAIELESRKNSQFNLNLINFETNGLANTTTIKTNDECELIINAYGEKAIIRGADSKEQGVEGCKAIETYNLQLNNYADNFIIIGGKGVNGAQGTSTKASKNGEEYKTTRAGKSGTNGATAISCYSLKINSDNSSNIKIQAGDGGNGGNGGNCLSGGESMTSDLYNRLSGGNGGDAGSGGNAIEYRENIVLSSATIISGKAGTIGFHGAHDETNPWYKPSKKGAAGKDGTPGKDGKEIVQIIE